MEQENEIIADDEVATAEVVEELSTIQQFKESIVAATLKYATQQQREYMSTRVGKQISEFVNPTGYEPKCTSYVGYDCVGVSKLNMSVWTEADQEKISQEYEIDLKPLMKSEKGSIENCFLLAVLKTARKIIKSKEKE